MGESEKFSKVVFYGLTPHQTCVQITWQSFKGWLRSMSRNLWPKPIKRYCAQT